MSDSAALKMVGMNIKDALVIMYLFNKSDIKTIVFPITLFSQSLVGFNHSRSSLLRLLRVVSWVWLELLEFTISNQTFGTSPREDAQNKPERPIPSRRISLENAKVLRMCMTPVNIVMSFQLGVLPAALGISIFTPIHNEVGGHSHWAAKAACTALLYAFFEAGSVIIAGANSQLDASQIVSIVGSAVIIFTTVHAQDFRDVEGDREEGRSTIPILYPTASRMSMLLLLASWSLVLSAASSVHMAVPFSLIILSCIVGGRFLLLKSPKEDRTSYLLYNVSSLFNWRLDAL